MKFSIRDLMWLIVVVALVFAWLDQFSKRNHAENVGFRSMLRLNWLMNSMDESGYGVSFDDQANSVKISPPLPLPTTQTPAPIPPKK